MTNPTSKTTTDQDASKKEEASNIDLVHKAHGQLGALEDDDEFEEFEAEEWEETNNEDQNDDSLWDDNWDDDDVEEDFYKIVQAESSQNATAESQSMAL
ncbi:60S ribosomal protein L15 [Mucor velutinosus]|uniref:26S proteasome complex subunit SEM1 n=1 Tax=Mucor velutinosus TaxID=708070 RepID=A0AAN7DPQ4_9FUNG|nr:60S ribosomal protein L15 [Mucor velutinosus]